MRFTVHQSYGRRGSGRGGMREQPEPADRRGQHADACAVLCGVIGTSRPGIDPAACRCRQEAADAYRRRERTGHRLDGTSECGAGQLDTAQGPSFAISAG